MSKCRPRVEDGSEERKALSALISLLMGTCETEVELVVLETVRVAFSDETGGLASSESSEAGEAVAVETLLPSFAAEALMAACPPPVYKDYERLGIEIRVKELYLSMLGPANARSAWNKSCCGDSSRTPQKGNC